uniref:NADH dehydrogenase subunit 6 n=1 Tax=Scutopus ventrolineatus TaxID=52922 RepID=A0A096XEB7_SCUVE|nr:NADH dehydrogenase subunit 6 [Scutopus ventrolineatus]AHI45701.1 NADH dehydrogenase subunit 6 [Scutopus ventrolineatus]
MMLLLIMLSFFVFMFPFMLQPLSLGILLISTACSMSVIFSVMWSSWLGLILFLMYIGGLLVMFVFVISFLESKLFFFSVKFISFLLWAGFSVVVFNKMVVGSSFFLNSCELWSNSQMLLGSMSFSIYVGVVMLLFAMLVIVVYICGVSKGSIRGF